MKEAIEYCFENIKPSKIGLEDYNKLRQYKRKFERGELGEKATSTLLEYFGFEKNVTWHLDKTKAKYNPENEKD